jgi:hypothetical protein
MENYLSHPEQLLPHRQRATSSVTIPWRLQQKFWELFEPVAISYMPPDRRVPFGWALEVFVRHFERTPPTAADLAEFTEKRMYGQRRGRPLGATDGVQRRKRGEVNEVIDTQRFIGLVTEAMRAKNEPRFYELRLAALERRLNWDRICAEASEALLCLDGGNTTSGSS